ncbi:MAG: hypothetical protein E7486_06865 [Ruminococcaceae bacterium]|nr:hypothetical protein [Oscillospiraceae bacterium]
MEMSKTIYISDMDGTLLAPGGVLSPFSAKNLSALLEKGLPFTVATARTSATVPQILREALPRLPVILMNGACLYDLHRESFVDIRPIPRQKLARLIPMLHRHHLSAFLYSVGPKGELLVSYEHTDIPGAEEFISERRRKYGKVFTLVTSLEECLELPALHIALSGPEELLAPAWEEACQIAGLNVEFYRDVYHPGMFFLEIASAEASKKNAALRSAEMAGAERIIGFGDNRNDLPLFAACHHSCAVSNGVPEILAAATEIIPSNEEDGVLRWLIENTSYGAALREV